MAINGITFEINSIEEAKKAFDMLAEKEVGELYCIYHFFFANSLI